MNTAFVTASGANFETEPDKDIMKSIFEQYESVIVESLITTFGLDFIVKDRYGGDVDTIHNVRLIGKDSEMEYKNKVNYDNYVNHEVYSKKIKAQYDSDPHFIEVNRAVKREKETGRLKDSYTGKEILQNGTVDLDHVISTKEIHEDRGRILSGRSGLDLANNMTTKKENLNLKPTERSINRSMKEKPIGEYCDWLDENSTKRQEEIRRLREKGELTDKERADLHKFEQQESVNQKKMKEIDRKARKTYEARIAKAYYTSPQFAKDVVLAAGNTGIRMGIRQAFGFVFAEIWFAVKREFQRVEQERFELDVFLKRVGNGIKSGVEIARTKYKMIFSRFIEGTNAGVLASVTTTLCNIFFVTAKNVVKLIRQSYASLVQAMKVLFLNPENLPFGERIKSVVQVLAAGASVVVGLMLSDMMSKTVFGALPLLGDMIQTFCGTLVTGILSCTFLYVLDRSSLMNCLVEWLNKIPTIEENISFYQKEALYFEQYAAQLMQIDLAEFNRETSMYSDLIPQIEMAETESELTDVLRQAMQMIGVKIPWGEGVNFDGFMKDPTARLVFE